MWWALKDQLHSPGGVIRKNYSPKDETTAAATTATPARSAGDRSPREGYFGSVAPHPHAHLRRSLSDKDMRNHLSLCNHDINTATATYSKALSNRKPHFSSADVAIFSVKSK
ncbi:unnamed protein product [Soboliphyme baturini]|uniref:SCP domain-containing protein n=1 Tax=Soboliphyme baturini TaxID=241478 RepID=A0A183JA07_9BILA|nr:unnamed protein product [Soboliphyme baturini]